MSKRIDFDKLEEAVRNGAVRFREGDEYEDWDSEGYNDVCDGEMEDGTRYIDDNEDFFADGYATREDDEDTPKSMYRIAKLLRGGDNARELINNDGTIDGVEGDEHAGEYFSDLDINKAWNREATEYIDY